MAGAKQFIVTSPLVIAKSADGDRYLYQGAVVPDDISDDEVARLNEGGFLEELKSDEPETVTIPEGDPSDEWTVKQLEAFAVGKSIDLKGMTDKPSKLTAILSAITAPGA